MIGPIKKIFARETKARAAHIEMGERGERAAVEHLIEREGFEIVATNFRVPIGRGLRGQKVTAEIDIIAYDRETLVFVEVKTRASDEIVAPERAVDLRKQRQIARAARRFRRLMKVTQEPYRYDVVTVIAETSGNRIKLLRGYFNDRVFLRARYFNDQS